MSVFLHTEGIQKLCRNCCQFLGKCSYYKEKYRENIKHISFINKKNGNLPLHPGKIYLKCYCVMTAAIKRKSTITTAAFKNWTEHSVQLSHLQQNSTFPKRCSCNPKIWFQEKKAKAKTKDSFWSQRFPCSTNTINNTSYGNITRSRRWRFKSPCFSLHMWNLLRNN